MKEVAALTGILYGQLIDAWRQWRCCLNVSESERLRGSVLEIRGCLKFARDARVEDGRGSSPAMTKIGLPG